MANVGINITFESVNRASADIRTQNSTLSDILNSINVQMTNLENSWDSDAYRKILGNFNKLKPSFDNYKEIIEAYAKFLDQTVKAYQDTENTNVTNASAFD